MALIVRLIDAGWEHRLLLSHDTCKFPQFRRHGGPGLTYIPETFLPRLAGLRRPGSDAGHDHGAEPREVADRDLTDVGARPEPRLGRRNLARDLRAGEARPSRRHAAARRRVPLFPAVHRTTISEPAWRQIAGGLAVMTAPFR